jgi:hypothetical protein
MISPHSLPVPRYNTHTQIPLCLLVRAVPKPHNNGEDGSPASVTRSLWLGKITRLPVSARVRHYLPGLSQPTAASLREVTQGSEEQKVVNLHRSMQYIYTGLAVHLPDIKVSSTMELHWRGKTAELGEKPVLVPLCPPQTTYGLTMVRIRATAVRSRRLTA